MQITPMINCIHRKPSDGICDDVPPDVCDGAFALMALSPYARLCLGPTGRGGVLALHHTILVYYIPNRKVEIDARTGCMCPRPWVVDSPVIVVQGPVPAIPESTPDKRKSPRISGPSADDYMRL